MTIKHESGRNPSGKYTPHKPFFADNPLARDDSRTISIDKLIEIAHTCSVYDDYPERQFFRHLLGVVASAHGEHVADVLEITLTRRPDTPRPMLAVDQEVPDDYVDGVPVGYDREGDTTADDGEDVDYWLAEERKAAFQEPDREGNTTADDVNPCGRTENPCASCGEGITKNECAESRRDCGHHCNHSWDQDQCCWCGTEFDAGGEAAA